MSRKQNKRSEKNKNNKRSEKNRNSNKSNSEKNNNSESKSDRSRRQSMDQMKYEIANEFGVNLGPEASSRSNGQVRSEMTKRLVGLARKNKRNKKCN